MKINSEEDLCKILEDVVIPNSSLGIHGIKREPKINNLVIANCILSNGLKIELPYYGLIGTICMLDKIERCNFNRLFNYVYGVDDYDNIINIIFAIPETIKMTNGDLYYIGIFPEYKNGYNKGDERSKSNMFNSFIDPNGYFPKEFIVGYIKMKYVENSSQDDIEFVLNSNYIGLKDEKEKLMFYDSIKNELDKIGCYKVDEDYNRLVSIFPKTSYYQDCFSKYYNDEYKIK